MLVLNRQGALMEIVSLEKTEARFRIKLLKTYKLSKIAKEYLFACYPNTLKVIEGAHKHARFIKKLQGDK